MRKVKKVMKKKMMKNLEKIKINKKTNLGKEIVLRQSGKVM